MAIPNELEVIMPVHEINTPVRYNLFIQACFYLHLHHRPVTVVLDQEEPEGIYAVMKYFKFKEVTVQPKSQYAKEWDKIKAVYDQSTAKYIAICHADDYWMEDKVHQQLKYIWSVPMVMSSYLIMEPHKFPGQWGRLAVQTPYIHAELGLFNCMPSMWMLNKRYVPELPIPYDAITALDLGIALMIAQQGPITVLREPTMIWNHHLDNNTHRFQNLPEWKEALAKQQKLAKSLCAPQFRYIPMEEEPWQNPKN